MAVNRVRLIYCMCNYASTYTLQMYTHRLMQMQIHELQPHVNLQIYARMRIESGFWRQRNRGGQDYIKVKLAYVHHSLADIDTKKLLTGEINQVRFFSTSVRVAFFLQMFDTELRLTCGEGSNLQLT